MVTLNAFRACAKLAPNKITGASLFSKLYAQSSVNECLPPPLRFQVRATISDTANDSEKFIGSTKKPRQQKEGTVPIESRAKKPWASKLRATESSAADVSGDAEEATEGKAKKRRKKKVASEGLFDPDTVYRVEFDGASRGNPGPAGCGSLLLVHETNEVVLEIAKPFGVGTNNEAEYHSLYIGMQAAKLLGMKQIIMQGDSQLVVRQLLGEYKVKAENLQPHYKAVKTLCKSFTAHTPKHVERALNSEADRLSNRALDVEEVYVSPQQELPEKVLEELLELISEDWEDK